MSWDLSDQDTVLVTVSLWRLGVAEAGDGRFAHSATGSRRYGGRGEESSGDIPVAVPVTATRIRRPGGLRYEGDAFCIDHDGPRYQIWGWKVGLR